MASRFMLKKPSRRHPNNDNCRESADVLGEDETPGAYPPRRSGFPHRCVSRLWSVGSRCSHRRRAMLEADLTGSDAHGVFRFAGYVRQLKRGAFNPRAAITVVERSPATALIDGDHGMGHVVMTCAANLAVELARASGVGWVGARRSNHAGAGAIYAAIPLDHDMVGIYGAASSVNHMAPWGGTEPFSAPTRSRSRYPPATRRRWFWTSPPRSPRTAPSGPMSSKAGRCRKAGCRTVRTARRSPTRARINEGTYLPMGDYKGSGLSIIIGLLAGPLNRRGVRPRHQGFCRAARRRAQCRAIRGRARRRAFCPARPVQGRSRPPHPRFRPPPIGFRASRKFACPARAAGAAERAREKRRSAQRRGRQASRRGRQVARRHAAQCADMSAAASTIAAQGSPFWQLLAALLPSARRWPIPASRSRRRRASTSTSCCSCFGRRRASARSTRPRSPRSSAGSAPWREMTVIPLRTLRRALKSPPPLVAGGRRGALPHQLKAVELEAERLQQEAMYELVGANRRGDRMRPRSRMRRAATSRLMRRWAPKAFPACGRNPARGASPASGRTTEE